MKEKRNFIFWERKSFVLSPEVNVSVKEIWPLLPGVTDFCPIPQLCFWNHSSVRQVSVPKRRKGQEIIFLVLGDFLEMPIWTNVLF